MDAKPQGAVALREALTRVPFAERARWAGSRDEGAFPCGKVACPHPSHWALVRLEAAWADLGALALPEPAPVAAPVPEPAPTVADVARVAADPAPASAPFDPADPMAVLSSTLAALRRDKARLDKIRRGLKKRLKRSRAPAAPAVVRTVPVPLSCPQGWEPTPVDPAWTPTALDGPMDWALAQGRAFPMMLSGPAGTGKTEGFRQACARAGMPSIVIPCARGTGAAQLLGGPGTRIERVEGVPFNVVDDKAWIYGDFARATKAGVPVCLDEMLAASPSALAVLHDCLASGILRIPETGEEIRIVSPIMATSNSVGADVPAAHEGEVSAPMLDRFVVLATDYGTVDDECALLARRVGLTVPGLKPSAHRTIKPHVLTPDDLRHIAGYQSDINAAHKDGKLSRPLTRRGAWFLARLWEAWGGTKPGFMLALEGAFLDRLPPSESKSALDIAQRRFPA